MTATFPQGAWYATTDVFIRPDQYDRHSRLRVMEAISYDASAKLHRQIEKLVLGTSPGTRLCLHTPEAWIVDNRYEDCTTNEVTRFRQFVHVIYGDACHGAGLRARSSPAVVYAAPWPCAFCWQRRAYDYERACTNCARRPPLFPSGGDPEAGFYAVYRRGAARHAQHRAWMQGYLEEHGEE